MQNGTRQNQAGSSNRQNSQKAQNGRYWIGTINNGHGEWQPPAVLPEGVMWMRGQKEIGEENGRIHWQLFAAFKSNTRTEKVKRTIGNGHWELSKSTAAEEYVWKEETRVEGSQFELGQRAFKRNSEVDWGRIRDQAKRGDVASILDEVPELGIRHYRTLKQIAVDYVKRPDDLSFCAGMYVYGPPGVGKSHWIREQYPDLYIKAQNKWWDGYQGQKFVLLDDLDTKVLGHYMKIWCDKYAFTAEVKGGTMQIRPVKFIITSNYKPEDLFEDPVLVEAIRRRCQMIHIPMRRF